MLEQNLQLQSQIKKEIREENCHIKVTVKRSHDAPLPNLTLEEELLKETELGHINQLLREGKIPRCIMIIDALVQRIPQDYTLKYRKAWLYYDYAKYLIKENRTGTARKYLKAATKIAPHDASLWSRINEVYNRLEHQY